MNQIRRIFKDFGDPKIIIMIRHGYKTDDGRNITPECIDEIIKNGVPGITPEINIIQHGSYYIRTDETVSAITLNLIRNGGQIRAHFSKDDRLANPELFGLFSEELKKKISAEGLSWHAGLKSFRPNEFHAWASGIDNFIFETFSKMNSKDVCLVPSHTPVVEMSYNLYAKKPDANFSAKELEYVFIVQAETGKFAFKQGEVSMKF